MAALTTEQKLEQAETAYHALMLGKSARVLVDSNGERLEFTAANAERLLKYINYLRGLLGLAPLAPKVNGPLNPSTSDEAV